jgi:putative transposase
LGYHLHWNSTELACTRYVAAVVDLFSRRVVGWSMSAAMTAQILTDALVMADHGLVCSMSRSGNI